MARHFSTSIANAVGKWLGYNRENLTPTWKKAVEKFTEPGGSAEQKLGKVEEATIKSSSCSICSGRRDRSHRSLRTRAGGPVHKSHFNPADTEDVISVRIKGENGEPRPAMSTRTALGPPKRVGGEITQSLLMDPFGGVDRCPKYKKAFWDNADGCLLAPRHFDRDSALSLIPTFSLYLPFVLFPVQSSANSWNIKIGDHGMTLSLNEKLAIGVQSVCPVLSGVGEMLVGDSRCPWKSLVLLSTRFRSKLSSPVGTQEVCRLRAGNGLPLYAGRLTLR